MFKSIRFRLTLWFVAILAIILLIFSVIIYTRQARDLQFETLNQLQAKSQQLQVLYLASGEFDQDHFQPPDLSGQGRVSLPEYEMLAMVASNGQVLQKAGGIDDNLLTQLVQTWSASQPATPTSYTVTSSLPGQPQKKTDYLFLITPLLVDRRWVGLLVLGSPLDPGSTLPGLLATLALSSLATLAAALAGGSWLAGRVLAPVRTITRAARGISETDLHQRLNLKTRDELGELADTFDAMLGRLQAAFDRQRQFTADASHELRTPMTIVGLEADQALERHRSEEEYRHALLVIKSENEAMARLVNDLLTLARMDAGQTHLKVEPLDLSDVALEVVERLTGLSRRAGVELNLGELPEVRVNGDRQYLGLMMANLVENAIKYAGGRGHHVLVETGTRLVGTGARLAKGQTLAGQTLASQTLAWVNVQDDGPGISPENQPHLFDRFYRVDKARNRQGEDAPETDRPETGQPKTPDGSGLGLAIVQWVAQAHNGQVMVRSEIGQGSCFEVTIPMASKDTVLEIPS